VKRIFTFVPVWLAIVTWFAVSSLFAADAGPARIEAAEPRVQIRMEVLKGTKLGATPADVLAYIGTHFQPSQGVPAPRLRNHSAVGPTAKESAKKGIQSIRLVLGQYLRNPATFLMEIPIVTKTTTTVQWAFDKEGKLIEVFVDKDSELGDQKGQDD
jgi:hypothetical protein